MLQHEGVQRHVVSMGDPPLPVYSASTVYTPVFIMKKDISLCYGLGMDMVHRDFPFQSIREGELKREIKGMANS